MYARLCQYYVIAFVFCTAHEQLCTGFSSCIINGPLSVSAICHNPPQ